MSIVLRKLPARPKVGLLKEEISKVIVVSFSQKEIEACGSSE